MSKKSSKKKKKNTAEDEPKSTAKAELEEAVNAVQTGEPYKKPLRDVGEPVYVKHQDFKQLEKDLKDQSYNRKVWTERKMSQYDQAQQRLSDRIDHNLHNLRGFMIILTIVVLALVGVVIWLIISMNNLSAQLAFRQAQPQDTTSTEMVTVTDRDINLANCQTNLNLTEAGTYTLTGDTKHQIFVTAHDAVTLNLANAKVQTDAESAIKSTSGYPLIINLAENTTNTLTSNGTGANGGTIHSSGTATITGSGKLTTISTQKYSSSITTKQPYSIEGGRVLAIGSDMLQPPETTTNPLLKFDLDHFINSGSLVQIQNPQGNTIEDFVTTQDFRTLMLSKPGLVKGAYSLLVDGKKVASVQLAN